MSTEVKQEGDFKIKKRTPKKLAGNEDKQKMPFKSQAQRKWMYMNHPEMAKRWEKETPKNKPLPKKLKKKQ